MQLPKNWPLQLIQLLSIPGMFLAYYLLIYHNGLLFSVCEPNGLEDCGLVSGPGARYSSIGPIPVALIGLVGYIVIFLTIWLKAWVQFIDDYLPELILGLTGIAFLFSAYLTALETFIIHAYCRYCLVSAGIIVIMLILAIIHLRNANKSIA
ncbi:MAG: hypothetical protein CSB13_04070 [Chloroflexi bacterium]|nr:MAG: hypothetical protein CSB13_04070 [Chloroflexota bacterium]